MGGKKNHRPTWQVYGIGFPNKRYNDHVCHYIYIILVGQTPWRLIKPFNVG